MTTDPQKFSNLSTVQKEAERALTLARNGKLKEAEILYKVIINAGIREPVLLYQLAIVCGMQGEVQDMAMFLKQALSVKPDFPEALFKLGDALWQQGDLDGAINFYYKALSVKPDFPEALFKLGDALSQQGDLEGAINSYYKALSIKPNFPEALNNLGNALQQNGMLESAISTYQKVLDIRPNLPETLNNMGNALQQQNDLDAAIVCYRKALAMKSNYPEALNNLGTVLQKNNDLEAAIACHRKALAMKPDCSERLSSLSSALQDKGDLQAAISHYRKAISINNFSCKDNYANAHFYLACSLLLSGDYENGWNEYEWRLLRKEGRPRAQPQIELWNGYNHSFQEELAIVSEGGLGDTLQFMRYIIYLKSINMKVSFYAQAKLHELIQASHITEGVYVPREILSVKKGKWLPLLSLPKHLKVTPANPLVSAPYIKAPEDKILKWKQKLAREKRPIIGINWCGNVTAEKNGGYHEKSDNLSHGMPSNHEKVSFGADLHDPSGLSSRGNGDSSRCPGYGKRTRSLSLQAFAIIINGTGGTFLSLQKGFGSEQLVEDLSFSHRFVHCQDEINQTWDFVETAAMIVNCDLVITNDTSVAHLAGGLGQTTWLLLTLRPDWRWGAQGESTFWYRSMRLFRQREWGNWAEVMDRVLTALKTFPKESLENGQCSNMEEIEKGSEVS